MKKFSLFLSILTFLFFSCAENLENQNAQQKSGNVIIKIENANSSARVIRPAQGFDISQVNEWTLTFTQITPVAGKESRFTLKSKQNSVTLGVGTYILHIEGSYTNTSDNGVPATVDLSGIKTNITVNEGNTTQVAVAVGLKKSDDRTGELSIELGFDSTSYNQYISELFVKSVEGRIKVVLKSKEGKDLSDNLSITPNGDQENRLTVSGKEISSGYYNLELYANYATGAEDEPIWRRFILPSDDLIEIADGKNSIGSYENLVFPTEYTYYASKTGSTESNGLSQTNPGNLYTVLENIYANNAVSTATINYTYSDSEKMEFDVSKVQSGKQVTISYKKGDSQASSSFTIDEAGLITFNTMNEELSLITTNNNVKKLNVKSVSGQGSAKVCLNNGVYLDFSSFVGNEQSSPTIYFDVDDVDYYENNPMGVSKTKPAIELKFKSGVFSTYQPLAVFTYEVSVKQNVEGFYEFYAQEPSAHIYYGNSSSSTAYKIEIGSNQISDSTSSIASWCDDGSGGIYIFKATTEFQDSYYPLVASPSYKILHYKKIESDTRTSFILNKEEIEYSVNNVPVSMCTDGSSIYYVESVLDISGHGGKKLELGSWGAWAHKDCKVKYFSIESPSVINELDFSKIFTNGKVTSVYYYNNELYVAGYKKESIGSITNGNGVKTEFFDSTYSVYKLSNPKDVSTATCVSDVFKNSTEKERAINLLGDEVKNNRIKSYNAITDMAIMDGKLYVLENSYYYASATSYIAKGSLRQISLENGKLLNTFDRSDKDSSDKDSFKVPNKILAVLPKKLELVIADSAKNGEKESKYTGASYRVNLSGDTASITEEFNGSAYYFDKYSVASDFFNTDVFNKNAYYTTPASTDTLVSE